MIDPVRSLSEALPYVSRFAGKTVVVKIGGSTLGSGDTTLADAIMLKNLAIDVVLVHGGGSVITDWLRRIDKPAVFVDGLRVTDGETMQVVTMALAGLVNKELVGQIAALGGRAVGISGVDGATLRGRVKDVRLGNVGEVTDVDPALIRTIATSGAIPVIAPIALGADGQHLNLNADTAAAEISVALRAEKLLFLTDVPGIKDRDGALLSELTDQQARKLIANGVIAGGMIPKAAACVRALDVVAATHIIDGRVPHSVIRELFTNMGVGTMIRRGEPQGGTSG